MTRSGRRDQALAVVLAGLGGYVDATGFLATNGFFLSFMSGNSTRLGAGLGGDGRHDAAIAGGIIALFVTGVVLGTLAARAAGAWRRPGVLTLVAVLLSSAAACGTARLVVPAAVLAVLGMGSMNAVFERDGEVSIGLTYMTGTLVKTGQGIARAVSGGPRWGWTPYAALWAGFVSGAVVGAAVFPEYGMAGLGWAAALALVMAAVTGRRLVARLSTRHL